MHPILKSSVTFLLFPKMFARILCLQTFSDFCLYFPRRTNRAPSESYFNISCFVQHSVGARREQKASLKGLNARQEMQISWINERKTPGYPSPVHCKSDKWLRNILHLQVGISYSSYSKFLTYAEVPAMGSVPITSLAFLISVLSFSCHVF